MKGIFAPDLEYPKNCEECKLKIVDWEYGDYYCPYGIIIRSASDHQESCPLVDVNVRGRLVSDRAVKNAFDDAILEEARSIGQVRATSNEVARVIASVETVIPEKEDT